MRTYKLDNRGVSELLAAALLALIAAILGFIIFYYALNIYSATMNYISEKHCDFDIIDVEINITTTTVNMTPIIYVSGNVPCKIVNEYVLINDSIIQSMYTLNITVNPKSTTLLPVLSVPYNVYVSSSVKICVVSSDGIVKAYTVKP